MVFIFNAADSTGGFHVQQSAVHVIAVITKYPNQQVSRVTHGLAEVVG